ncbi:MAG: PspC domain-containing protein [Candidatus Omnitrophica bacterium]|nr:PspC domain-containing protein [Candidatus Omnitrophota bacterium]MCB9720455.1 PspC domain-containing protein [Candidatus Omnitrophota bacterium]
MKKLCRLQQERKIAGICSGLGEYFGMDPVIFRVLFILSFFVTVGGLVYLVMWIMLPLRPDIGLSPNINRLYALEEGKKVAGISAGLGHFFGIDPNIFRVLFVVSALAGGAGLIIYIILYFILPRSQSARPPLSHAQE